MKNREKKRGERKSEIVREIKEIKIEKENARCTERGTKRENDKEGEIKK